MKVTLMACSGNPEVLWSAFRMGNLMLEKMDDVTIFLNGPSVDYASLASRDYSISELAKVFPPTLQKLEGFRAPASGISASLQQASRVKL